MGAEDPAAYKVAPRAFRQVTRFTEGFYRLEIALIENASMPE